MPFIYDAVKAYATLGEICDALRESSASTKKSPSPERRLRFHGRHLLCSRNPKHMCTPLAPERVRSC